MEYTVLRYNGAFTPRYEGDIISTPLPDLTEETVGVYFTHIVKYVYNYKNKCDKLI